MLDRAALGFGLLAQFVAPHISCADFPSFASAQGYYLLHPAAQPLLDPDADGSACEDWFGLESPDYLPGGPLPTNE